MQNKHDLVKWFNDQLDDAKFCDSCWHELEVGNDGEGKFLYCPNEICLDEERYYVGSS